jgi:hypothetical protein
MDQFDTGVDSGNPCGGAWRPSVRECLDSEAIASLVGRRVPYVHVPSFLDPLWCEEIVRRFTETVAALPDHQSLTMGPMRFDTLARPVEMFVDTQSAGDYFSRVAEDAPRVRALFEGGDDPLELVRRAWRADGWVEVAAEEDAKRRYHSDVVWGIHEAFAPPHVDAYEHERVLALSRFPRHINFNVYIQNADRGGEFIIYNRCADRSVPGSRAACLEHADLEGVARLEHRASAGDLVIFDAMFYHEVTQVDGSTRRRVQTHSNMLVDPGSREFLFYV